MQPLIGVSAGAYTRASNQLDYYAIYAPLAQAIVGVGGLPVLLPAGIDAAALRALYERLDGVLLPGGPDIDSSYFGEEPHPTIVIDAQRDEMEVSLARWARDDDRPLFGICRGCQVINVAFGGSLVQDIPSQLETDLSHQFPNGHPRHAHAHTVEIAPGSKLAAIMGATSFEVNSFHHQAIKQPAPGFCVTAHSPDQMIEAFELPEKRFMLSVQWHPEDMLGGDEAMQRLFAAFVEAAREYASG